MKEGDLLFQDLDSSPLCDAIEKVTSGIYDLNFSHIGIVTIVNNEKYVLEAFVNGVDTVPINTFLDRSLNNNGNPKVVIGRLKKEYISLIPNAIASGMKLIGKQYGLILIFSLLNLLKVQVIILIVRKIELFLIINK